MFIITDKHTACPTDRKEIIMQMIDRVKEVIAKQLRIDIADIDDNAAIVADLGADSLDIVEMLMTLEDEMDIIIDLFFILKNTQITPEMLVQYIQMKYGENYNFSYMLMGLDYFEDADNEILPEQFVDFDWNQAKKFFVQIKKEMINYSFSKFS